MLKTRTVRAIAIAGFFEDHPEMIEKLYLTKDRHEAELIIARAKGVTA